MNRKNRWQKAQTYEKEWWKTMSARLDLEYYQAFAEELKNELSGICPLNEQSAILEIGSGAAGTITYLPGKRCALDPLEHVYGRIEKYRSVRDSRVKYLAAQGERLPYRNGLFDLIIIDNVLDHCEDPRHVITEMGRVLKNNGIIYFRLNTYHWWGKLVRSLLEILQLDRGHPHSFRQPEIIRLLSNHGFTVRKSRASGYFKTWLGDVRIHGCKSLVKSLLFINRNEVLLILTKTG